MKALQDWGGGSLEGWEGGTSQLCGVLETCPRFKPYARLRWPKSVWFRNEHISSTWRSWSPSSLNLHVHACGRQHLQDLDICMTLTYLDSRRLYCRTPEKWFGGEFTVKWFGFRPESQSYRPKVGVTDQKSEIQPGRPPESEPNRPEKGPRMGLRGFYRNPPLKPS